MIDELPLEPVSETLWRSFGQTDVLIHVESCDTFPVDVWFTAKSCEHLALARCRCQDEPKVGFGSQALAESFANCTSGELAEFCAGLSHMHVHIVLHLAAA